ncbi:unnamed protein product [Protopolystoma xenopodis]|uniref:Uncharacterized protein n=1 Tax=Protopolystoma xenopodis TaxID=117903 RepID=A0A3S5ARF5_9PLAT|nr:unnamed protein product [Protopolystoma xenopodis]
MAIAIYTSLKIRDSSKKIALQHLKDDKSEGHSIIPESHHPEHQSLSCASTWCKFLERRDEYLSSREWIAKYGIKARHLDLYSVLEVICFRHCDGVINLLQKPSSKVPISACLSDIVAPPQIPLNTNFWKRKLPVSEPTDPFCNDLERTGPKRLNKAPVSAVSI